MTTTIRASEGCRRKRAQDLLFLLYLTVIAIAGSSGCAGIVGSSSSSQTKPPTPAPASALVVVTPATVSFGNVAVGSTNTQTLQVSNGGTAVLNVTQVSASGSGFSIGKIAFPISINPGSSSTFNAQFSPGSAGSATGSVSIVSNDPSSPKAIALGGSGVAATQTLSFSPSSLNFGNVDTGASSSQTLTVTNTGNANVQISQIGVTGASFTLNGASTPVTVTPAQTFTFSVVFRPTAAGSSAGAVSVTSNATGSPASIALSGTGVVQVQHSVLLDWTTSPSATAAGYNVYRSTANSGYTKLNASPLSVLTYSDTSVQNSQIYYYVATAVDASGNESPFSNIVQMNIP